MNKRKLKETYFVFDANGAFIISDTLKNLAEHLEVKYKSLQNAHYQETSMFGLSLFKESEMGDLKLTDIMRICRARDRRFVDTTGSGDPVYQDWKSNCILTQIPSRDIEDRFSDQQILDAEMIYKNSQKNYRN